MSVNLDELTKPFPREAIKARRGGGGKELHYVEGHTVIHRLNAATGNQWSFRVLEITSRTITTQRDGRTVESTLMTARVELELPGLGTRQHIGVQMVNDAGGEDLVKGAITDALKKAATLFGVGLELYGPDYESGELPVESRQHAPQARQRPHGGQYAQAAENAMRDAAQPPTAPRQMNPANADEPATEPQIRAIFGAGKRVQKWEPDQVKAWVADNFGGKHIDDLSRKEASQIIDHLNEPPVPAEAR